MSRLDIISIPQSDGGCRLLAVPAAEMARYRANTALADRGLDVWGIMDVDRDGSASVRIMPHVGSARSRAVMSILSDAADELRRDPRAAWDA